MADTFLFHLKQTLDNCIAELDSIHSFFCQNPVSDFTRNRKITFSAYIQHRQKILTDGWDFLFHSFVNGCSCIQKPTYRGYRLLACDGSDVNIARTPSDEETFIHKGEMGYSMLHINALYDLLNHSYCDFIIQGKKI